MAYASLFIDLEKISCLMIGGDEKAFNYCRMLCQDGARVSVWSSEFCPEFSDLTKQYAANLSLIRGTLTLEMAEQLLSAKNAPQLVVAASGNLELDAALCEIAGRKNILSSDTNSLSSQVHLAPSVQRGALKLSVSAPCAPELEQVLSRRLKREWGEPWTESMDQVVRLRESAVVRKMRKEEAEERMNALAEALSRNEGSYMRAVSELERQAEKKGFI